jgi:uncharacterized protein (TIGR02118 family)
MAKMIIMYEQPKDKERFEKHYFDVHVPLGKKMPHIIKNSIHRVQQTLNSELNLFLITVLEFESIEAIQQSLASPEAKDAEADLVNMMEYLHNPPIITIVE